MSNFIERQPIERGIFNQQPFNFRKLKSIKVGAGDTVFNADYRGIWLGAAKPEDALFHVDMKGNLQILRLVGSTIVGGKYVTSETGTRVELSGEDNALYLYESGVPRVSLIAGALLFNRPDGVASASLFSAGTGSMGFLFPIDNSVIEMAAWAITPWNNQNLGSDILPDNRWNTIYLTNSPDVSSDIRLKKNIRPLSYGLEEVLKINPISFTRKGKKKKHLGFSAQNVQDVLPEIVNQGEDGYLSLAMDEMIPVLVNAIQELEKEVSLLKRAI